MVLATALKSAISKAAFKPGLEERVWLNSEAGGACLYTIPTLLTLAHSEQ